MKSSVGSLKAACLGCILAAMAGLATAEPPAGVASAPVYVPNTKHANEALPAGILAWDQTQQTVEASNGQAFANFVFAFTNVAQQVTLGNITNFNHLTNYSVVTNSGFWNVFSGRKYSAVAHPTTNQTVVTITNSVSPMTVAILTVHPSCGCTTAEVPAMPWVLPPGTNSLLRVKVNLNGKSGILPKHVTITTDQGHMDLNLLIKIAPPPPPRPMTPAERAVGVAASQVDRQAVFKGDCASCHAKDLQGRYGQQLFAAACAVCHEATPRATMVPDLHNLKDPTSEEFWRTWITSGKAGTLMPAFGKSQGGPLTDFQISSLAAYLNQSIPPHPQPAAKQP